MNFLTYKRIFFTSIIVIFFIITCFFIAKNKYKELSYRSILGLEVFPNSKVVYSKINEFQKENKITTNDIQRIFGYLNIENAFLRFRFKGNHYFNNNINISYNEYSINKNNSNKFNKDDIIFIENDELFFIKNSPNICSLIIIGHINNNIIYMDTLNSFGVYVAEYSKKNHSMICKKNKNLDISINSFETINENEKYLQSIKKFTAELNKIKKYNNIDSHELSLMIMSSNTKFNNNSYKNIYDDGSIFINKEKNIIYSKFDQDNIININKDELYIISKNIEGKIDVIGSIKDIHDKKYTIAINKGQATYIYHVSELRKLLITD